MAFQYSSVLIFGDITDRVELHEADSAIRSFLGARDGVSVMEISPHFEVNDKSSIYLKYQADTSKECVDTYFAMEGHLAKNASRITEANNSRIVGV